jgi:hypothetical protein
MEDSTSVEGTLEALHEAVHRGLDLRKYSDMVEKELKQVEGDVIHDYLGQYENVLKLHSNLTDCDNILEVRWILTEMIVELLLKVFY